VGKRSIKVFAKVAIAEIESFKFSSTLHVPRLGGKVIQFRIGNKKVLAVHIPHRKKEFDQAMEYVKDLLIHEIVDLAVGDVNFGYQEESPKGGLQFRDAQGILVEPEAHNVVDTQKGKGEYSYLSNKSKSQFRLDHLFSKYNIAYQYIGDDQNEPWVGYDHKGMLFNLKIKN
jgi:hypothetical protein